MSNLKTVACVLVLSAVAMPSPVQAAYTGLTVQLQTVVTIDGSPYDVYRIYANFDDPNDRLVGAFGSPNVGFMTLQSRNASDTGPGSAFYRNVLGGNTAPSEAQIGVDPNLRWHSFGTIGVSTSDQAAPFSDFTFLTPGFPPITGNSYTTNNAGWFAIPTFDDDGNSSTPQVPPPQTLAGWLGDGDPLLRVMLLQLTVAHGDNVRGTINIDIFPPLGQGPGQIVQHQPFQTFNSFASPAPGALALLGLGALFGRPRRRD
jgi:MYXO-CTERM domain-containing protein